MSTWDVLLGMDTERQGAKDDLLMADLNLRNRQAAWETPKNIAIPAGALAALFAATFGVLGYKLGSRPPQSIVVQFQQPLGVKALP